jgi:hypothetical protein
VRARGSVGALPCDLHGQATAELLDQPVERLDGRMRVADQDAVAVGAADTRKSGAEQRADREQQRDRRLRMREREVRQAVHGRSQPERRSGMPCFSISR